MIVKVEDSALSKAVILGTYPWLCWRGDGGYLFEFLIQEADDVLGAALEDGRV